MTDIPEAVLAGQDPVAFITTSGIGRLFDVDSKEIVSVSRSWQESQDCQGVYLKPQVPCVPSWVGDLLNRRCKVEAVLRKGEPLSADQMKQLAVMLSVPTEYQALFVDPPTSEIQRKPQDAPIIPVGTYEGKFCTQLANNGYFDASAEQLVHKRDLQAEVDAAAIAQFAADLDGMGDDELKSEIVSAQNELDEIEPWLEALHAMGRRRGLCV